jgi:hypothetical protein
MRLNYIYFIDFKTCEIMVDVGRLEEPGSSGSIVSDYGLNDRAIGVRSPAGSKHFSL